MLQIVCQCDMLTSLVNILETELDATTAIPLRFGPIERNARIEDEISDVSKYLETIEKLYASNEDFEVIDEPIVDGYQRRMRFRTKDLLNQTANYEMVYNQSYNKETKRFTITGEVKIGERSYPITAEGVKGEKGIIMTAKKDDSNLLKITSPMVGTFYRAASPGAAPFADAGKTVSVGQTVCIIEAMKLMNEIESEVSGKIVEVCVQDGEPVEYGQVLMLVEP